MKRTELKRKAPLVAKTALDRGDKQLKRAPIKQSESKPKKRQRDTGPTRKVRNAVKRRAQGKCELCGEDVPDRGGHIHHVDPRGMGGTRRPEANLPSNLLYLHPECHLWVEDNRLKAIGMGLLLPDGVHPLLAPVQIWHDGQFGKFVLTNDGRAVLRDEHTAGCAVWASDNPCDCAEES